MAASACAVSVALLAGCSGTQGTGSLPSGAQVSSITQQSSPIKQSPMHGKMSFQQILQAQISGKMVPQAPIKVLKALLKKVKGGQAQFHVKPAGGTPSLWTTNEDYSYLLGLNKSTKKVLVAVNLEENGCYDPTTVKVDHSGNVWNSCEYNSSFSDGAAQEYTSNGTLENTYTAGCPSSAEGCSYSDSYSYDQAENSSNVFIGLPYLEYDSCYSYYYCYYYSGSGFEYWPLGSPSSEPTFINVEGYTLTNAPDAEIFDVTYFDVDGSNIYYVYYGYNGTSAYGYGLGEVENYATSATNVSLLSIGSIEFGGGVWVGGSNSFVSVLDQESRYATKYALPWTGSSEATYGPTKTNAFGDGDPISGGYNSGDTQFSAGDGYGWIDRIILGSNKTKAVPNINCSYGCYGASYAPSDK